MPERARAGQTVAWDLGPIALIPCYSGPRTTVAAFSFRGVLAVAPRVGKLTLPPDSIRFLSFAEADAFIDAAAESPTWSAQVVVALRTGLRIGELLASGGKMSTSMQADCSSDVPSGKESKALPGRPREIPLSDQALEALGSHPHRGRCVFARLDGERRDRHGCTRALYTIAERAGQEVPFGWHVLRHTFA